MKWAGDPLIYLRLRVQRTTTPGKLAVLGGGRTAEGITAFVRVLAMRGRAQRVSAANVGAKIDHHVVRMRRDARTQLTILVQRRKSRHRAVMIELLEPWRSQRCGFARRRSRNSARGRDGT